MFDSLADQIRHDEEAETNNTQRAIKYLVVLIISVLLFGGLYFGVRMLEG